MPAVLTPGLVVEFGWRGQAVRFFARDLTDTAQSVHTNGAFYEERELAIVERFLQPGAAYLEIGCGVGNGAVYVARFRQPREMILVASRDPETLKLNLLLNRLTPDLAHLAADPTAPDSLLAGRPIDFIRIDLLGRELDVLAGLERTLAASRPALFVRVADANRPAFDAWAPAQGYKVADALRRFRDNENLMLTPAEAAR